MYQYKAAKARRKGLDSSWLDVNLADVELNEIYSDYSHVILTLTHVGFANQDLFLDMNDIRGLIQPTSRPRTLAQWLVEINNQALPHTTVRPSYREHVVRCADAWAAGYEIVPVDRKRAWNAQVPLADKNDLLLRKATVDFRDMWKYCMVSVNGLFHRVGGSEEGLYVVEGGRTGRISDDNLVSLLSFRGVGELDYLPIQPGMLYKTHTDQQYSDYVNVKLRAPVDRTNKTLLLVLGGYLHILDEVYEQTSDRSVRINMNRVAFIERLFESMGRIHLADLQLETAPNNPTHAARAEFLSDKTIAAYCTLAQSFFIVVDTDRFFARRHDVEKTKLPGRFVIPSPAPKWPLFSALGRHFDYKTSSEWGRTVLSCENARDVNYNFLTSEWLANLSLDAKDYSAQPWDFARGYLLEMGSF